MPPDVSVSPAPLRVLRVIGSVSTRQGGTANVAVELERELETLGVAGGLYATDVDAFTDRLAVEHGMPVAWRGVTVVFDRAHAPFRLKTSIGHGRRVWTESKTASAIHVHELYAWSTVAAWASARRRNIPLLLQPHGVLETYHQAKSPAVKKVFGLLVGGRIMRDSFAIVCASDSEAKRVTDLGYCQTRIIPHGVHLETGEPSRELTEQILGPGPGVLVLSLGRLAKKKNPDLLIRAWAIAKPAGATLLLAGPDDYWSREALGALTAELGVSDSVRFWPTVEGPDKTALLNRADLFVLPSNSENFGITVPEAMVAGTACLASAAVATSSYVAEAEAGAVIEGLDVTTWARSIAELTSNRGRLRAMGQRAGSFSASRFDWAQVAGEYVDLYRNASDAAHTAAARPRQRAS
jgi:glycosyltransferase involved in cell wall biosynthesis